MNLFICVAYSKALKFFFEGELPRYAEEPDQGKNMELRGTPLGSIETPPHYQPLEDDTFASVPTAFPATAPTAFAASGPSERERVLAAQLQEAQSQLQKERAKSKIQIEQLQEMHKRELANLNQQHQRQLKLAQQSSPSSFLSPSGDSGISTPLSSRF